MIARLLLLFLLGLFLAAILRMLYLRYRPSPKQLLVSAALALTLLVVMAMVAAGRLHWLFALGAAVLPFAGKLLGTLGMWHLARKLRGQSRDTETGGGKNQAGGALSRAEALEILELEETPDRAAIVSAHRRLMQKYHPDHGGTEYFATRINAAKERLLADL